MRASRSMRLKSHSSVLRNTEYICKQTVWRRRSAQLVHIKHHRITILYHQLTRSTPPRDMSSDEEARARLWRIGISGWSILNQALSYPTPTTFDQITGLTNRPLSIEDAGLPSDPRLQLANGVDLTDSVESVVSSLKSQKCLNHHTRLLHRIHDCG